MMINKCYLGDARDIIPQLKAEGIKIQSCITSPPYLGLRDYGHESQIGQEKSIEAHIKALLEVFGGVKEILNDDGLLFVNYGPSYNNGNLTGIPWRLAFALQEQGWILRSEIIWHKPNAMPESVKNRPTNAHETIFMLSKKLKYYYDHVAVIEKSQSQREQHKTALTFNRLVDEPDRPNQSSDQHRPDRKEENASYYFNINPDDPEIIVRRRNIRPGIDDGHSNGQNSGIIIAFKGQRNMRSVLSLPHDDFKGSHYAAFPQSLVGTFIKASTKEGDIVFDPFMGSGTTAHVAVKLGRKWLGCEINESYHDIQKQRLGLLYDLR
jgi:DNA modification methylase